MLIQNIIAHSIYCTSINFGYVLNFIILTDHKDALNLTYVKYYEICIHV